MGSFNNYGGAALNRFVRIERNGSRDASFAIGAGRTRS
ncbi:MAG: hypothetical protein IPG92_00140 [Flavobacteriales bacterium]|nr:hypothetical protein [Flavobacteriales bacterium]